MKIHYTTTGSVCVKQLGTHFTFPYLVYTNVKVLAIHTFPLGENGLIDSYNLNYVFKRLNVQSQITVE